jgi:hypothetical protein
MMEGVEESRRKRMPSCNGADRAAARRGYPARKGADFRWVSAESRNLDASTGGDVRRRKLNRPMGKGNESSPCQANPGSDVPCRSGDNPLWWRLEPDDGQLSRPVLRGLGFGNGARLPAWSPAG